jgi:penicillin-binding protein 1C
MKWFRKRSRLSKILILSLLLMMIGLGAVLAWVLDELPSIDDLEAGMALPSTRIYDRNQRLLYEIQPPEQGRNSSIDFEAIPQYCIHAVIATEDANYYSHPGVDPVGIVRAIWINLQGGDILAGGSTITQQTARILLLDPQQQAERTLHRKLREMVLALQLQARYSKEDILVLYLNQVYFGNLAYGIDGASRAYFQKDAHDLSLAECALLIGTIQNANLNDPLTQFDRAKDRQAIVLDLMVQNEYLTENEALAAKQDELQFGSVRFPIGAPHFVMEVWKILERDYPNELHAGGLEVITTVDLDWTNHAQDIVQKQLFALNHPEDTALPANANNAAVVALNPTTGEVLTMLGSPNFFDEEIDGAVNVAMAYRQPGSTLKPFTFAEAMNPNYSAPYTAATMILDVKTPFITNKLESYTPANYGLVEHGPVLVREALASSYNIPAVVALEHIGMERFVQFVSSLGLDNLAGNTEVDLSIALGGGEVRLIDLAEAYSAFANGGYDMEPQYILKITDAEEEVLFEHEASVLSRRIIDEGIAHIITDILSDNNARIPSFGDNSPLNIGFPAAAKTGTTTDFRDNWVMGYTSDLVVGVWVGNANNSPMIDVTGVSGAGPIYNLFMRTVKRGENTAEFVEPDGLIRREVCSLSGLLPTETCTRRINELFLTGTQPTDYDTFHQAFSIDIETGLLATDQTPPERVKEQTFLVLPQEARDWAVRKGIAQPPLNADVFATDANDDVRLLSPDPFTVYEISELIPIDSQRLRLTVGTPSDTREVLYVLNGQAIGKAYESPWDVWWTLELGQHELTAVATLDDGTIQQSTAIPFSVVEDVPLGSYDKDE